MKCIGIIGGMSYNSTLHYYEQINREVNKRAGGLTSADLVIRSVNFEEYHELMERDEWDKITFRLTQEVGDLILDDGCDYVAVTTDTTHKVASEILTRWEKVTHEWIDRISLMYVHIGDCVADECERVGAKRVLLLGTKFTMTEGFMKAHLAKRNIEVMDTSNYQEEIDTIDHIIFDELCHDIVTPESKEFILNFAYQFPTDSDARPDAIILGCTELDMILEPDDIDIPLIDSTQAHINKLVELCLS